MDEHLFSKIILSNLFSSAHMFKKMRALVRGLETCIKSAYENLPHTTSEVCAMCTYRMWNAKCDSQLRSIAKIHCFKHNMKEALWLIVLP